MELNIYDGEKRGQVGIGTLIVFIAMVLVAAIAAGVLINTAGFLQTQAEDTGEQSTDQVANSLNVITEVGEVSSAGDKISELRVGVQPAAGADDINLAELTVQYVSNGEFANLVAGHDTVELHSDGAIIANDGTGQNVDTILPSSTSTGTGEASWEEGDATPTGTQAGGDSSPDNIVAVPNQPNYLIDVITAENTDDVVMTDSADRYEIVVPLNIDQTAFDEGQTFAFAASDAQPSLLPLDEGEEVELTVTTDVGSQTVAYLQVPDSLSGETSGTTVNL